MTSLFDHKSGSVTDSKLIKSNVEAMRKTRIAQAEAALQQLKNDIATRTKKLQEVIDFLNAKKALHTQLTQQYKITPDEVLAAQINKLKPAIERLENKLTQSQPEKTLADLNAQYEALQLNLKRGRSGTDPY